VSWNSQPSSFSKLLTALRFLLTARVGAQASTTCVSKWIKHASRALAPIIPPADAGGTDWLGD
jgi:hypothetical protein